MGRLTLIRTFRFSGAQPFRVRPFTSLALLVAWSRRYLWYEVPYPLALTPLRGDTKRNISLFHTNSNCPPPSSLPKAHMAKPSATRVLSLPAPRLGPIALRPLAAALVPKSAIHPPLSRTSTSSPHRHFSRHVPSSNFALWPRKAPMQWHFGESPREWKVEEVRCSLVVLVGLGAFWGGTGLRRGSSGERNLERWGLGIS